MKTTLLLTVTSIVWFVVLAMLMTQAFAWEQYDEKTAINSDYNKQETNPTNYHKDRGFGFTRVE
jgi:uncharacterized membrane protein